MAQGQLPLAQDSALCGNAGRDQAEVKSMVEGSGADRRARVVYESRWLRLIPFVCFLLVNRLVRTRMRGSVGKGG